jgi:S1-C subfamily serine protease
MEAAPASAEEPQASPVVAQWARWQGSVVGLWTERRHAGGFIVSDKGLIATSLSGIGDATSVEVQLSPTDKVTGRVVATDAAHDVAVVRIDPAAATHAPPVRWPADRPPRPASRARIY